MQGHVFISYARDGGVGQHWAEYIQRGLEARGIACWRDETDIETGKPWPKAIQHALDDAVAFVCVCSDSAHDSAWVQEEILYYGDLLLEGRLHFSAMVEKGVQAPFGTRRHMWAELRENPEDGLDKIAETVRGAESSGANRRSEISYLNKLIELQSLEEVERLYIALDGQKHSRQIARLSSEQHMRSAMNLVRQRFAKQIAEHNEPQTEQFDDILDALRASQRLVVLGEPGVGKTYSLKRIAAELARQALEDGDKPLPLFVPLKEWIDAEQSLERFIAEHCGRLNVHWRSLLEQRRAALLFDGINELPTKQRKPKLQAIRQLCDDANLRVLIASCRELDYRDMQLGLDELHVQKLEPTRVHHFCRHYCAAWLGEGGEAQGEKMFWHLAGGDAVEQTWRKWKECGATLEQFWSVEDMNEQVKSVYDKTSGEQDRIWKAARFDPRSLVRLAEIPYLLTLMAGLYLDLGGQGLPRNRSALFDVFVDALVDRENQRHREANDQIDHPGAEGLQATLANLAWTLQNRAGGPDEVQLALPEDELHALLSEDQQALAKAASLLEVDSTARFPHQLLQEYFTATGMRARIEAAELPAEKLWPREERWKANGWEESTVLLSGFYEDDPGAFIDWLGDWHPRLLIRCIENNGFPAPTANKLAKLKTGWLPKLNDPLPESRQGAGVALGYFGLDDRAGIGLCADGLPDIDWAEIASGDFIFGAEYANEWIGEEGNGPRTETLPSYHLSRYPITNAQYQSFINAGGYDESRWWDGLAQRIESPRPSKWPEPNRPRTDVSWYEAIAFCRWLSEQLGHEVRLPTEQEWEKGARGMDGREYPWGNGYREGYANIDEGNQGSHNIGETTAVGLYPQGGSPYGLQDMSGNIWEWCLNEHRAPEKVLPGGEAAQVLRGGSWFYSPGLARSAIRLRDGPDYRSRRFGFRVCCSSPISSDR